MWCLLLFVFAHGLHTQERTEIYRSNFNGLMLLKIEESQKKDYSFVLINESNGEKLLKKTLFEKEKEIKRWEYAYTLQDILREESYYRNDELTQRTIYNELGHKTLFIEFRDGKIAKNTRYEYNKDGLVALEEIDDQYLDRKNKVRYRYDEFFRIKQIVTELYDGRVMYWDSFFTPKGIISKEYYTLQDKKYIFYYNENGQETQGEVFVANKEGEDELFQSWSNTYASNGARAMKDEINVSTNVRSRIWYDENGREIKEEKSKNDEIILIVERI